MWPVTGCVCKRIKHMKSFLFWHFLIAIKADFLTWVEPLIVVTHRLKASSVSNFSPHCSFDIFARADSSRLGASLN
jgi:hypothetical protein